jgi:hypothetical protein
MSEERGTDFYFITNFPTKNRAFYTMPLDETYSTGEFIKKNTLETSVKNLNSNLMIIFLFKIQYSRFISFDLTSGLGFRVYFKFEVLSSLQV